MKKYGKNFQEAIPSWSGGRYEFLDMEVDITPNYIPSDEMLLNAVKILKAADGVKKNL